MDGESLIGDDRGVDEEHRPGTEPESMCRSSHVKRRRRGSLRKKDNKGKMIFVQSFYGLLFNNGIKGYVSILQWHVREMLFCNDRFGI